MKQELDWNWPDKESHIPAWLRSQHKPVIMNGRQTYQGKKQINSLKFVTGFRNAVDVGAHIGLWSYNMAHAFQHVYSFEPVPDFRDCFIANVRKPNVTLYPYALGEETEFVTMAVQKDNTGSTHVCGTGDVEVRTLDSFEFQDVDFIKIDCEGYELKVLKGARETLLRCRPALIVEQKRDMATERYGEPMLGAVDYLQTLGAFVHMEAGGDFIMSFQEQHP